MLHGFTSFAQLVEQAKLVKLGRVEPLTLEFASLTTFSRGSQQNKAYGNHHARLPLPHYVFPGLAKRWQALAPSELATVVQPEHIEAYCQDEGVIIADYDLKPHQLKFTTHVQLGFVGTCKYALRGSDEPTTLEEPLTVRQQLLLLGPTGFLYGRGIQDSHGDGKGTTNGEIVKSGSCEERTRKK